VVFSDDLSFPSTVSTVSSTRYYLVFDVPADAVAGIEDKIRADGYWYDETLPGSFRVASARVKSTRVR
jgi:hypothetical protein